MASTAGKVSNRGVITERSEVSLSDFEKELERLEEGGESKNILIHGDSNVGKTWVAGTCPGKSFWLFCEPGWKSASRMGARGFGRRISNTAEALTAVRWLEYKDRYKKLDWLVLDGLSTMQDRFRLAYAAEAFDINPEKRQHRNLPDKPDYFNTQNFLKSWIPQLVDMPVNLLITAHSYRTDMTENGELLVFPGVQGKTTETANAISGLMDVTAYMERKTVKLRSGESKLVRRMWFDQPPEPRNRREQIIRYICGDKFNALGTYMDGPTIPKLLEKIDASS